MRLHDYLDYQAREHPGNDFAILGGRHMSYGEALSEANRVANALAGAGLEIGDRVAVLSKNSIEMVILFYAASKAGVVLVPLNYRLAAPEWSYIINDAGAKMLIASAAYVEGVDGIKGDLSTVRRFVAIGAGGAGGWEDFEGWRAGQPAIPPDRVITDQHDVYRCTRAARPTSKGAVLTTAP
jgi:acyl-CoA synthetase (AMP-forming)/AMP-acid ligase II